MNMVGRGDRNTTYQLLGVVGSAFLTESQASTKTKGIYCHTRSATWSLETSYPNTPTGSTQHGVGNDNE